MRFAIGLVAAGMLVLAGCGTTGGSGGGSEASSVAGSSWRKVTQVEQRTAAFVSHPVVRTGDQATFGLAFVYAPGQIMWEQKPVAWQIYESVTIDCAKNQVRLGKRTRYDESGAAMMSDEDPNFAPIVFGTIAADAAVAACKDRVWVDDFRPAARSGWQTQARANLAATSPPQRPNGWHDGF